jgi:2-polyprenyl-6-hydroxyphenyl methylase/3-demethylubiquinone-9 3-methyltransferase
MSNATAEKRFAFGKNWQHFLSVVDDDRVKSAEKSLVSMIGIDGIEDKSFLDIGSGSGLFSLAAARLGAERVLSFDYDEQAVACTKEMKTRFLPDANNWKIMQASVLDNEFISGLGKWDIVYSWGVLHHTGNMMKALENVVPLVRKGGILFIAIYNDQGGASRRWRFIKKTYNSLPKPLRPMMVMPIMFFYEARYALVHLVKSGDPFREFKIKGQGRGMSKYYDWVDWIGGYPFEVATPEVIFDFYKSRGFVLEKLKTCGGGYGCNEYVFTRKS